MGTCIQASFRIKKEHSFIDFHGGEGVKSDISNFLARFEEGGALVLARKKENP
jgi:hypothetical protein